MANMTFTSDKKLKEPVKLHTLGIGKLFRFADCSEPYMLVGAADGELPRRNKIVNLATGVPFYANHYSDNYVVNIKGNLDWSDE